MRVILAACALFLLSGCAGSGMMSEIRMIAEANAVYGREAHISIHHNSPIAGNTTITIDTMFGDKEN